ncbi:SIP domain-containing protein (plasmid) [Acinetobacter soli]|nr:SIP domain-containing protein [Acinetobacter soli]WEH90967.1 SIP domain-containing protein [Acinetobacter soli]WEH99304.1 SIP domain-containing protein [Acinetobacter soli]WEI02354.1 SIP domain-containing protein [Acinetobacter soli]
MSITTRSKLTCKILSAEDINFGMRRLIVSGQALEPIFNHPDILKPAAWVKLFPQGIPGRAYTLRSVDLKKRTLTIDFVIHGDEPTTVSSWARDVQIGSELEIAGPRNGGFELNASTRHLWIAADTTALPAALSIIESLPSDIKITALFIVPEISDVPVIKTKTVIETHWLKEYPLCDKKYIQDIQLDSSLQIWIAGEAAWIKEWKNHWIHQLNLAASQVVAKGYWKLGELDYRD